jgi:hypothetical protein
MPGINTAEYEAPLSKLDRPLLSSDGEIWISLPSVSSLAYPSRGLLPASLMPTTSSLLSSVGVVGARIERELN